MSFDLPSIKKIIDDVAFADLERNHVAPNIGDMNKEGIWFPRGYE